MTNRIDAWTNDLREVLQDPASPLSLKNGLWEVKDRKGLWQTLGSRLYDEDLDRLKDCAVEVLTERDPKFDLPPQERYAAAIYEKQLQYSYELRKGLAECLALMSTRPQVLTHCSLHKAVHTAAAAVRDILHDDDWVLWGSLDDVLPILAEASPREFIDAVNRALQHCPGPLDDLFAQEESGFTGGTYLSGLLRALETIAWEETLLVPVCFILAKLAERDPGGNWANRPENSLATILLPWLPQTFASFDKQEVAITTLRDEHPEIAWKILLRFLPNETVASSPTSKPSWRDTTPEDWQEGVDPESYINQVSMYARLLVEMAIEDAKKLNELIEHLENLPEASFEQVLDHLSNVNISEADNELNNALWRKLTILAQKHKDLSDAEWAFGAEDIARIEDITNRFAPQDPEELNEMLFTPNPGLDMYTENVTARQQQAVAEILSNGGITAVIGFARKVEFQYEVGRLLAVLADENIDKEVLPLLLEPEDGELAQFTKGYVQGRHHTSGWPWVDGLDKSNWSVSHIGNLLSSLPFTAETWRRTSDWLVENEGEYWRNDSLRTYVEDDGMEFGIRKLLEYGRPRTAIRCLSVMNQRGYALNMQQTALALLDATRSQETFLRQDSYYAVTLIKTLQDNATIDPNDLARIEWAYLPLLNDRQGILPKTLERELASNPSLFSEVIRIIYRSSNSDGQESNPSEDGRDMATNAWQLLRQWRISPGLRVDGSMSSEQFQTWLSQVREKCTDSGHLEVAMIHIGQVLIHAPPDPDGLWIHRVAADALNKEDAEAMREGFRGGAFNSRGTHWVDPTARPERELADKYRRQAEEVENAGYHRFAVSLRELANIYDRDADRIIERQATAEL